MTSQFHINFQKIKSKIVSLQTAISKCSKIQILNHSIISKEMKVRWEIVNFLIRKCSQLINHILRTNSLNNPRVSFLKKI